MENEDLDEREATETEIGTQDEIEHDVGGTLKHYLINYVGQKKQPEDNQVNVEMIVETMAEEFPEFLMVVAEENFIRGYQQAFADLDAKEKAEETVDETEEQ
tara:strand:- start:1120 stop:1425 length:306 start_codon:yes stop_codon:yes gene_type:complete